MDASPALPERVPLWEPALLALLWGLGLALPALSRGELLGHGATDLYPSVWGLWAFAQAQPGLPAHTPLLGFPEGMGFYYSAPIKGWLATPLLPLLGLTATWNLLTVAARVATVMAAWLAGRAWGLGRSGALVAAAAFGCAPFFHGYAVEGIAEGTDGWTLALLVWALGRRRHLLGAGLLALTLLSSWYLGAVGCLLSLMAGLRDRRALLSLVGGIALVSPALSRFAEAFPAGQPLPDDIRAAMGAPLRLPRPGLLPGLNPFALNAYLGFLLGLSALVAAWQARRSRWLLLLALVPALLSLGEGPWYDLPPFSALRFPYRWHAATLALLALAVGQLADRKGWPLLGPLIALEGLLLSPVEPLIPGADPRIPALYAAVQGPLLELPGPVALPPGQINPARLRSRYLLYFQTGHGGASPWVPDFNGVGAEGDHSLVAPFRGWDRLEVAAHGLDPEPALTAAHLDALRAAGIHQILLQERELGDGPARRLAAALVALGAEERGREAGRRLLRLPPGTTQPPR